MRAQASSLRTREHVEIARLSGAGTLSLIFWEIIPFMLSYVVMAFVLQLSSGILTEATLSMLGLGPSGSVSLGIMLQWALLWESVRTGAWWAFVPPALLLTLIAFSLLLLQSSIDEIFNPRLRRVLSGSPEQGGQEQMKIKNVRAYLRGGAGSRCESRRRCFADHRRRRSARHRRGIRLRQVHARRGDRTDGAPPALYQERGNGTGRRSGATDRTVPSAPAQWHGQRWRCCRSGP